MGTLEQIILKLSQNTNSITSNPVLNAFDKEECKQLDSLIDDSFISEKIDKIQSLLSNLGIDYDNKYASAFQEYSEAVTYLKIKNKLNINRVPETKGPTPDFYLPSENIYIELKAPGFFNGNLNYRQAQNDALEANIEIEKQRQCGNDICHGIYCIKPFYVDGMDYSYLQCVKNLHEKIESNIKEGQFAKGDTILMVDLKLLPIAGVSDGAAIKIDTDKKNVGSGILWNIVFGNMDDNFYEFPEFEGSFKRNIVGKLNFNGLLNQHDYIKGIIFVIYKNFTKRIEIGFFREKDENSNIAKVIQTICGCLYNDDYNSSGFLFNDPKYR